MNRVLLTLLLLLAGHTLAAADVLEDAIEAYERKDYADALGKFKKIATMESPPLEEWLAKARPYNPGVPDEALISYWRDKYGETDWSRVRAHFYLASMYAQGHGVPQDYKEAARLLSKAAEAGHVVAQSKLGAMYYAGLGVPQDYAKAMTWYQKAAEAGDVTAQFDLAEMYANGQGVPQDFVYAHKWLNLAGANAEDEDTRLWIHSSRDRIARQMSPQQIAEAQRLAREWKPSTEAIPPVQEELRTGKAARTGTGFIVSRQGHVLTNHHVVEGCASILATAEGMKTQLTLVGKDVENDLAVLKLSAPSQNAATFRGVRSIRAGDAVVVVGFPLHGLLVTEAHVTSGTVSALAGIGNDTRFLQITAPVQPGNSGGPLLDQSGQVVGVVVSKLDAVNIARATGDIPQNINFAINGTVAKTFLDSHSVGYETAKSEKKIEPAEIATVAKQFTLLLECFPESIESPRRALEAEQRALEAERKALEKERRELAERHRAEQESNDRMLGKEQKQREVKIKPQEATPPHTSVPGIGPDMAAQIQGVGPGSNAYLARVQQLVSQHWTAPPVEMTDKPSFVVIRFRLNRTGEVSAVVVEQSSGIEFYDLAAKLAVLRADPLPPFPKNLTEPYYDMHIRFAIGGPSNALTDRSSFDVAYQDYFLGRYDLAVLSFQSFIKNFSSSSLVADAYYWLGESFYNLKDYHRAIQAYERIVVEYPKSQQVPSALYKIGLCAAEVHDTGKARKYLQRAIEEFPSSEEASLAKAKLSQLR